ncbi:SusC/RagA family TonB-linked outer membrane protein [Lacibacter sp. H375]|uniref:SusC/RagA family TonB-linked outer membrane protein n=1 Tax=Lacibacter sp. H375 TaxID=3133424 RepID=UPI0030BB10A6
MLKKSIKKWSLRISLKLLCILSLLLCSASASAQNTVAGTVTDTANNPIPKATVVVKGKSRSGVTTNEKGEYRIVASVADILIFTSSGFQAEEIRVGPSLIVNASMNQATSMMNEVVVVGYGTTARKNLTTSISKIDAKSVPQAANSSVAQLVFGRAAGVQAVQRSAEPGGNINISIRGRGAPLVIIDGVVTPFAELEPGNSGIANELNGVRRGGFAGLNPDDIESIEFLKDASAAIYGVNASNGVVLITTKKGKSGRLSVSYDGSRSFVKNNKYLKPLDAADYMNYYNQLTKDKYLIDKNQMPFGSNAASGFMPKYSTAEIQNAGSGTDWLGLVLRNGSIDNHNLSVSGGTEKAVYFFSANYFNQEGTMRQSGLKRYTGRVNLTFHLNKFLSLNTNISGSKASFKNSTAGWQNGGSGTQGFGALQAAVAYPRSIPLYDANGKYSVFQTTGNPVSLLDISDKTDYTSLNATASLEVKIIGNELTGRLLFGNNSESSARDFFVPSTTFYFQLNRARASLNEAKRDITTVEATLTYKKKLLDNKLNFDAVTGVGQYGNSGYGFGSASADMLDAIGTSNLFAGSGAVTVSSYKFLTKTRSYFARATFDLLDKYVLQLIYRYDGFNNFFPQNKYAPFPSASVAWKVSNESFLKNNSYVSLLKLRASIGVTGDASGYAYANYIPDNSLVSFNSGSRQIIPYALASLDHPELQWPKTINKNIGLDFGLLKDRINGSFDWFRDDITRLITNASTAPLSFLGTQPVNGAHRVRTGWEVSLSTGNIDTKDFKWTSSINVSHVLYKHEERFPFEVIPQGGQLKDPVNSIYVFQTSGILQIGEVAPAWQPANAQKPGAPKFVDVNGDKKLDKADIVRYNADPKFTIGFGNNIKYKQFDLAFLFYGQVGAWGYNNLVSWATPAGFISGNQSGIQEIKNVWSTTNPSGTLPGVAYDEFALGLAASVDTRLEKTDFIRCRNITLGYTFNQSVVNRYFNNLRLYADVQNPFIITNYRIADPEVQAFGVKGGPAPYPMATTYSLGIKANF